MVSVLHFLFSIDQQKTFQSSSVFNRYGRNTNYKSFPCPFFLKNLRGIVRKAEVRKLTNSVVTESSSRVTKRAVRQRFYPKLQNRFFSATAPNDRGYGLGRAAGGFPVAIATKEMRAQRLPEAQ